MIKVNFHNPTLILTDGILTEVKFVLCHKVLIEGSCYSRHLLINEILEIDQDLIFEIKSIEHVKPTDL